MSIQSITVAQRTWPNFAALVGLAWLAMVAQLLMQGWAATAWTLPDADDAMRLAQVRNFLAGAGWFDLHEPRLGLAAGYESHWSRLIDMGLAGLFLFFRAFTDVPMAERLMVTAWPMLWLVPTLIGAVAIAWRLEGREAALIVLLLAIFNIPGLQQFRPGRIDHHNVQIALAMLVVAATVWSDRVAWAATAAGVITGLSLAISFEGLPIHVLCGAALALRFIADRAAAPALTNYGLALSASAYGAFYLSVAPAHLTRSVCDAIAINSAAAVVVAGLGVHIVGRFADMRRTSRIAAFAIVGLCAALVFALSEPHCLAGPYALIDPAIVPIWLGRVAEFQTLLAMAQKAPLTGVAMAAFPVLALVATLAVVSQRNAQRDFGALVAAAAFLFALVTMIAAIKAYSYVVWLGAPFVAAAALRLFARLRLDSLVARFVVALLITPTIVTAGAMSLASAAGTEGLLDFNSPARQACVREDSYAPLARLPKGRVVSNELEWGPYILAFTPHAVLGAPYHRLTRGILGSHRALAAPPDEARKVLAAAQVDYLAICGKRGPIELSGSALEASLWGRLAAEDLPKWIEPVSVKGSGSIMIYRVKKDTVTGANGHL